MIVYLYVIVLGALTVTHGSTTSPPIMEDGLPGHSNSSLLYTLLQVAGFSETCVNGVLDYCSSAQEEAHYPSLIQEVQEVKVELQEIQAVKAEVQEMKGMVQQVMLMLKKMSRPRHCMDLLYLGDTGSGLRHVYPYSGRPDHSVTVYCDQIVDGGGWTIFQRRVNNIVREDFYRNWTEYQTGFGDLNGEFWLGLDLLYELTKTEQELRVDLDDYEGGHRWAKYGIFRVGPENTNYRLTVGRYSGDAKDSMEWHNGQEFSTHDADHDKHSDNCAVMYSGAWWYNACHHSNLNGYQYVGDNTPHAKGIVWGRWRGWKYSLKQTTMKLRPAL